MTGHIEDTGGRRGNRWSLVIWGAAACEILGVTVFFAVPWLVSAALFWNAAREQAAVGSAA